MGGRTRQVVAVVLSILVLTATAAGPAVGALRTQSQTETASTVTAIDQDLTPFEKKQRALKLTQELDPEPGKQAAAAERAERTLRNSSWSYAYRDPVRVKNKTTFETDAKAVRALGKFDGTRSAPTAHRASKLVVAADDESAEQAIEDAWRAYDARKDTMSKGERRSAMAHIENAERALDRARAAQARAEYAENSSGDSFSLAGFTIDSAFTWDSQKQAQKGKKKGEKNGKKKAKKGKEKDNGEQNGKEKKDEKRNEKTEKEGQKDEGEEKNEKADKGKNGKEKGEQNGKQKGKQKDAGENNGKQKGKNKDGKKNGKQKGKEKNGEQKGKEKGNSGDTGEKKGQAGRDTETNGTATETPPKKARGKNAFTERAQAIVHLKIAFKQAHVALERIDGASEPGVTIESAIDPVWQDGQPDRYYLTGNYTDVVIGDPEPVTVTIGNRSQTVEVVSASTSPMANQTFLVEVKRTERIAEIEVRAPDGETDLNGTESLLLDGDGLPERIEREVGSDPRNPDSDVSGLVGDQADDGIHDGAAVARSDDLGPVVTNGTFLKPTPIVLGNDTDGDGIPNWREQELRLNASTNDTDGDGISDRYETNGGAHVDSDDDGILDAFDDDSDGDGVIDPREQRDDTDADLLANYRDRDDDGDGISTATEVANGSTYFHDVDFDDVVNWRDTDSDADGIPDGVEGLVDHDSDGMPAYLDNDRDNDGLPDFYERNVTGTDPRNNDSDAPATAMNEASNGTVDGAEDFDDDLLVSYVEYRLGTDPLDADTDGDGLPDGLEPQYDGLSPLEKDTDGDDVSDGEADLDGDGLSNAREVALGTNLAYNDSDGDGLADAAEVQTHGTDPLVVDTDGDGLSDGDELVVGTDPLDRDSDDDGVRDGDETFETTASDEETGVIVSVSGEGNLAKDVTIRQTPEYHNGTAASAGPTVAVDGLANDSETTVTIPVNESVDASNLSIFVLSDDDDRWHAIETAVDAANGTASAAVAGDALVTVLNETAWEHGISAPDTEGNPASSFNTSCEEECTLDGGSLVLGSDESGIQSMSLSQTGEKTGASDSRIGTLGFSVTYDDGVPDCIRNQRYEDCTDDDFDDGGSDDSDEPTDSDNDGVNDADDACPNTAGSGSNGCPVDSDNDGVADVWDDCPTSYGDGPNGCPLELGDIDRDGYSGTDDNCVVKHNPSQANGDGDGFGDACDPAPNDPTEPYDGGDGGGGETPIDSDGDGLTDEEEAALGTDPDSSDSDADDIDDGADGCPLTAGAADNGCPVTGEGLITTTLPDNVERLSLELTYATESHGYRSDVSLTIRGEGSIDTHAMKDTDGRTVSETFALAELAGQTVTFRFETTGSRAEIESLNVRVDSDGDGLWNHVEGQSWLHPKTGNEFSTDPYSADTDGDGLDDDEEVQFANRGGSWEMAGSISDPSRVDSDGDSLDDAEEVTLQTDPALADTDGDGMQDSEDAQPTVPSDGDDDQEQAFHLHNGKPTSEFLDGMIYGDWGYVHDREGSRTAAYIFGWVFPFVATAAGTLGPLEDPVEFGLEMRECLAINDALWENALDCGFAAWELVSTGAKIVGAVTSVVGFGAVLAAGAIVADEIQDVGRAVTAGVTAIKKVPPRTAQAVGRMFGTQFGDFGMRIVKRMDGKIPGAKHSALTMGVRQGVLENAGLSRDVAKVVAKNVDDVEKTKAVVTKLDGLDEVPVAMRSDLVTKLAKRGDATRLASAYDANTLQKIISAAGSGGSKGDDLLDKAVDAAKTGKADELAEIAKKVDKDTVRYILETDSVSAASRHLDSGLSGSRLEDLVVRVKKLNGKQGGDPYLFNKRLSKGTKFTLEDIGFAAQTRTGDDIQLINTNKWNVGSNSYDQVHGWRKIVQKHVHPQSPGSWPVKRLPESAYKGVATKFPKHMNPREVKDVIKMTIKKGTVKNQDPYRNKIIYTGADLPKGINKMRVVYHRNSGRIITAHKLS